MHLLCLKLDLIKKVVCRVFKASFQMNMHHLLEDGSFYYYASWHI